MPPTRPLFLLLGAVALATTLLVAACGDETESAEPDQADGEAVAAADGDTDQSDADPAAPDTTAEGDPSDPAGDDDGDQAGSGEFPITIESDGGTWTIDAPPQRIVSLSPSATEMLFAVGAGDQVVAVDEFSNHPPEAPTTDLSGFDPNVEALTAYEPDLVIAANDANEMVAGLTELEIPVLVSPAPSDIEGGYEAMAEIGLVTGHVDETADAIATMRTDMEDALAAAGELPLRVYHEVDDTYFAASSSGFVGSVYAALGAENIADEADTDGSGFPQLTEEYIVEADPELIVITDQVAYGPDDVAARPGWDQIAAVRNGSIIVVEADIASRWGPRLPQFVSAVADAMASTTTGS